jgi:hypothetical protein
MRGTQLLHDLGQSIWIDNITRDMVQSGTLKRYIDEFSVRGLTSNPTIFDHAIKSSSSYDASIRDELAQGKSGERLFFDLALADVTRAADLLRPTHESTNAVDGWASLEVPPSLAHDTAGSIRQAKDLFARGGRKNLFIKIPGTKEGLPAIETSLSLEYHQTRSPRNYEQSAQRFPPPPNGSGTIASVMNARRLSSTCSLHRFRTSTSECYPLLEVLQSPAR